MQRQWLFFLLMGLVSVLFFFSVVSAASGIKERMAERLPEIVALKDQGVIGEDNLGYLQFVGAAKEKAELVQSENDDRLQVYQGIAKQQGTTADLVGRRRAQQIMDIALPGHWLQDENGRWYKK
ncbi:MAG: YdbL family protein [Desulfoarculaceae bacterium]|nr:YdbL family protein [Desulfoarculaceae bacterium]